MKKILFLLMLGATLLAFGPSSARADTYLLDYKGDTATLNNATPHPAYAILYTDAMNSIWTSAGSGVIDPFLTVQKNDIEKGLNTDFHPPPYNAKRGGNPGYPDAYTHSLQYSDLRLSPFGFLDNYFNFSLDADQQDSNPWVLLTEFEVWKLPQAAGGALSTYEFLSLSYGGVAGQKMFDLTGDQILLDYSIWKGSGNKLDMALLVPFFSGNPTDYIYVWTEFGIVSTGPHPPDGSTNDGPEEWIMFGNPPTGKVPEPSTMLLLGSGLIGLAGYGRKRLFKK